MKFTVVFGSHESFDYSYGLVFIPSPSWVNGGELIVEGDSTQSEYSLGGVASVLNHVQLDRAHLTGQALIAVHPTGHGQPTDLKTLQTDLEKEGFTVTTVYFEPDQKAESSKS